MSRRLLTGKQRGSWLVLGNVFLFHHYIAVNPDFFFIIFSPLDTDRGIK